jgi:HSP20 family protein
MYNRQAFQSEFKGNCGQMNRGKFGGPWGRGKFGNFWARQAGAFGQPPVNIEESDSEYVISLFAAGLRKENVTLTVKDDMLRIGYTESTSSDASAKYTYQEYSQSGFERSFQLNSKVLTDGISASYADGILRVTLPKNPETNAPAQTINVA